MPARNSSSRPTDSEKSLKSSTRTTPSSSQNQWTAKQSLTDETTGTYKRDDDSEDEPETPLNIKCGAPVMMITGNTIWKIVLGTYFFNALCILYDIMLMVYGIQIQVNVGVYINMISDGDGAAVPVVLFLAGFFCFPTNVALIVVTWYSCSKHRLRLMNTIHFSLIIVLLCLIIMLISFAIFCVVHAYSSLTHRLHDGIMDAMKNYKNDTKIKKRLDILQITFQCCGSLTYSEWFDIPWYDTSEANIESNQVTLDDAPFSCCSPHSPSLCIHHSLMSLGSSYLYAPETNLSVSAAGCRAALLRHARAGALHACAALALHALLLAGLAAAHRVLQTAHAQHGRYQDSGRWHTAWLLGRFTGGG